MNIKITRRKFIKSASVALPIVVGRKTAYANALTYASSNTQRLVLWYEKPATPWVEALPVGNGRLGAMVFGGKADSCGPAIEELPGKGRKSDEIHQSIKHAGLRPLFGAGLDISELRANAGKGGGV